MTMISFAGGTDDTVVEPCLDIFQAIQDASRTGPNELRAAAADTETFERSLTEPETPCCITLC